MNERRRKGEPWLRAHGVRRGLVYTMTQVALVALAVALAVMIGPQVSG
jgi:hypothetical protein